MSSAHLVARMKDFFTRQIAAYESMLRDLESLQADLSDPELEKIVIQQDVHARATDDLEREFRRLSVEWESCHDLTETDRAAVRVLAHQAGDLAFRLALIQESGFNHIQARLQAIRSETSELRRGRELLGKYGHGGAGIQASFVDKKA